MFPVKGRQEAKCLLVTVEARLGGGAPSPFSHSFPLGLTSSPQVAFVYPPTPTPTIQPLTAPSRLPSNPLPHPQQLDCDPRMQSEPHIPASRLSMTFDQES